MSVADFSEIIARLPAVAGGVAGVYLLGSAYSAWQDYKFAKTMSALLREQQLTRQTMQETRWAIERLALHHTAPPGVKVTTWHAPRAGRKVKR